MIDGLAGRPFSAETLPPLLNPEKSVKEKIIKVSRERYGTKRLIVEEKISRWVGVLTPGQLPPAPAAASAPLYDARCAVCGRWTKVIFPPDAKRPVYCKTCLKKIERERPGPPRTPSGQITEGISLRESQFAPPIPFSFPKKEIKEKPKPKRKEVNLEELKKILEKSLKKNIENENPKGL